MSAVDVLKVGQPVHGFAGGYFGRDSYVCRRVEAVGADWVVTRNANGVVELLEGRFLLQLPLASLMDEQCEHCPLPGINKERN